MIFPIVTGSKLLGVLTVADKANLDAFNKAEFRLLQVISKDLALLINNSQLQDQLKSYLASA